MHLVGTAAFKAVGTGDPRPAGSIPVHLRQHPRAHLGHRSGGRDRVGGGPYDGGVEFEIRLYQRSPEPFTAEAIAAHVDRLAALDDAGRLIAAGPLGDGSGGLILARFDSADDAQQWAATEPFVTGGWETVEVRPWQHAHRGNDYLDPTLPERRRPSA